MSECTTSINLVLTNNSGSRVCCVQETFENNQLFIPTSFQPIYPSQHVVQLLLSLDPKGILYSTEVNQTEPLVMLSRFGGLWTFVGICFGLLYTAPATWVRRGCSCGGTAKQATAPNSKDQDEVTRNLPAYQEF